MCNTCLAITVAIRCTQRQKLYQEIGLESLQLRRWCRKLCLFYNILKNQHSQYLFNLIPVRIHDVTQEMSLACPFLTQSTFF